MKRVKKHGCLGGIEKVGHSRGTCKECFKVYQSRWRQGPKGSAYEKKYQKSIKGSNMVKAKSAVNVLVRAGSIPRVSTQKCFDCGAAATIYDHRDYLKPLEIEPVCHSCNAIRGPGKNRN